MKNSIKYVVAVTCLSVVTIIGLIIAIFIYVPLGLFSTLPGTAVVGGVIAFFVRSLLYKKYEISEVQLSHEQKMYRKKHIKITSVIFAVVILISLISPFVVAFIDSLTVSSFNFSDGIGYQYSTQEEAKNEYYKLKNHVTDNKPLYYIVDECSWEDGTYTLWVEESGHSYHLDKNGYQLDYTLALNSEEDERIFNSQEEAEKFKHENVLISDHPTPDDLQRNITFDDEALTINWQYKTNYLNSANDILPAFLLVAYIVSIVIIIISLVIYFRKKKKIG